MATEDSKLKFLPRHLQRSQPAMSNKSKRRVTVEEENVGDESDRRSVFDRLGPGGSQRNEKSKASFDFQDQGEYAKSYSGVVKDRNKRDTEASPDNLRLKFKGGKDRETKVKSQVVVRGKTGAGSDDESGDDRDEWSMDKLEHKKEPELEQKRLEIQRALEALEANEDGPPDQKKSDSSVSDSSPERSHSKKKDKTSKKKEKKKSKKSFTDKDVLVEKTKEGKRKHGTDEDDDEHVSRKKRKKKNKDKKHNEDPPVSLPSEASVKPKKAGLKGGKLAADLYDPESPTSVPHEDTPDDKRFLSSSPKLKNKGKKKKKKVKAVADAPGKAKKLLSPLKKVLKLKRGPASLKRSRSPSAGSPARRHSKSRSSSSSSDSSSSHSTARKKKGHDSAHDRGRKASKSVEKKKRVQSYRSASSTSSSSSSSSSSSDNRGRRRQKKSFHSQDRSAVRSHDRSTSRAKLRSPVESVVRKEVKVERKKRGNSADSWPATKDERSESRPERQSLDRGRDKGRKDARGGNRHSLSQAGRGTKENRQSARDGGRKDGKDQKTGKTDSKEGGRRDGGKGDRGDQRKDNRDGGRGDHKDSSLNKDREKRGGSQDERTRRGFTAQQAERGGRFPQRSEDGDRRTFEEPRGRFTGTDSQRVGQFGVERQRGGFERGSDNIDRPGQREGFEQRGRGRGGFSGRGGETRGGRDWDERGRREGDNFRDEWENEREGRGGFGSFREGGREFGGGREERRQGGREERLLPHLGGGGDAGKLLPAPDSRGQPRGSGFRDDDSEKRDWKPRDSTPQATSRKNSKDRDRSVKDEASDRTRADAKSESSAKVSDKDVKSRATEKSSSSTKQSTGSKAKPESGKEESPMARDETSLATLFSQTETTVSLKKKTTSKSFGGKKSPKKPEDTKAQEKGKTGVGAARRGIKPPEKKAPVSKASESSRSKDASKDDRSVKKDDTTKEKSSRTPSPKGSQKSGDSRHSQSKSSRRSSKSPEHKRGTARSPGGAKRPADPVKSPAKASHSPAPSSVKDRDRGRNKGNDRRNERSKKRERSRSLTRSDSGSRHSSREPDEKRRRKSSDSESLPTKLDGDDIAAAMLNDGLDDLQDAFSDWTDDDEEELLLQVEDWDNQMDFDVPKNRRSPATSGRMVDIRDIRMDQSGRSSDLMPDKPLMDKNLPRMKIIEDIPKEKPAKRRPGNNDDKGYEEISSDENDLYEEGDRMNKRTIVSILDIDIASLMPAAKPSSLSGPVFQRFKAASLFSEMGLSKVFAGDKLYREVEVACQREMDELSAAEVVPENKCEIKSEAAESGETKQDVAEPSQPDTKPEPSLTPADTLPPGQDNLPQTKPTVMQDPGADPPKQTIPAQKGLIKRTEFAKPVRAPVLTPATKPVFKLYGDTSAYHKHNKAKTLERSGLLANFGMFRRALTARKDLEIRRQLCKIDPKYDQSAIYPSGVLDHENFRLCMQLFKLKRPSVIGAKQAVLGTKSSTIGTKSPVGVAKSPVSDVKPSAVGVKSQRAKSPGSRTSGMGGVRTAMGGARSPVVGTKSPLAVVMSPAPDVSLPVPEAEPTVEDAVVCTKEEAMCEG